MANYYDGNVWPKRSNPRFLTPFGVAETGQRDGLDTQEALARLHSGRSLNRSQPCAAEGGGSFAAPSGARSLGGSQRTAGRFFMLGL